MFVDVYPVRSYCLAYIVIPNKKCCFKVTQEKVKSTRSINQLFLLIRFAKECIFCLYSTSKTFFFF